MPKNKGKKKRGGENGAEKKELVLKEDAQGRKWYLHPPPITPKQLENIGSLKVNFTTLRKSNEPSSKKSDFDSNLGYYACGGSNSTSNMQSSRPAPIRFYGSFRGNKEYCKSRAVHGHRFDRGKKCAKVTEELNDDSNDHWQDNLPHDNHFKVSMRSRQVINFIIDNRRVVASSGNNFRPSISAGDVGKDNNQQSRNPSSKPSVIKPKNKGTTSMHFVGKKKLQNPSGVQALTNLTNRKSIQTKVVVVRVPKKNKKKAGVLEGYDLYNYARKEVYNKRRIKNEAKKRSFVFKEYSHGKSGKNRRHCENKAKKRELKFKEDGEEYALVVKMLGDCRLEAMCFDGKKRLCRIRGKLREKVWINEGNIILVGLREYQDAKADVILKYRPYEIRNLKTYGELPDDDNYMRTDLNLPSKVPKLIYGPLHFYKDCVLTQMGLHQATSTGSFHKMFSSRFKWLRDVPDDKHKVYCSICNIKFHLRCMSKRAILNHHKGKMHILNGSIKNTFASSINSTTDSAEEIVATNVTSTITEVPKKSNT